MNVFVYFFFFKQKTAYELRISDWSSDVCSSDLRRWRTAPARVRADQPSAAGAGAAARPAAAAPVAGDPRLPRRNVAAAATAAGRRARPRAGARTGAADRLRRAPAQQPARNAVPGARLGRAPARARGLVAAREARTLSRVRGSAAAPPAPRRILRRR